VGAGAGRPRAADSRSFLYLPFTVPHSPFQAPTKSSPRRCPPASPRWNQGKAPPEIYAAMIERMDTVIGQLLATVDELRLAPNTLVIFTSDNGGTRSARPSGLREYKGTTFEGGIRVPAILRWPGVLPAGRTDFRTRADLRPHRCDPPGRGRPVPRDARPRRDRPHQLPWPAASACRRATSSGAAGAANAPGVPPARAT
jgi:arylsulfatase A-like enzyme